MDTTPLAGLANAFGAPSIPDPKAEADTTVKAHHDPAFADAFPDADTEDHEAEPELPRLDFVNFTFHPGANVTVRKGRKWAGLLQPGAYVKIGPKGESSDLTAVVASVTAYPDVNGVHQFLLNRSHDKVGQTLPGLLHLMEEFYGPDAFIQDRSVTVVEFVPLFGEDAEDTDEDVRG